MLEFGGRAVEELGLVHDSGVDPRTGAATLRVPVPVPAGRGAFGPSLTLAYSSRGGNSPFGAGWELSGIPSIAIDTARHLPRWDGSDGYALGGDELVPWLERAGAGWRARGFDDGDWSVAYHRSRAGGSSIRVERWLHRPTGRIHFRTRDARNVLTIYGARPDGTTRITDPADASRTFAWLPELQIDPVGNAVWLEYRAETADGIDRGAPFERRQLPLAQRYLKTIRYGNVQSLALTEALIAGALPAGTRWCFHVVFDYGDHADPQRPALQPDRAWPMRADPFSYCRAGFEVRTYRLCRRILSFHDFDELGAGATLVGALTLRHDEHPAGSTLAEIGYAGHRRDGAAFSTRALPPLRMTYAQPATAATFVAAPEETQVNLPAGLTGARVAFVDLHGEGLPGIVAESDRSWFYKRNEGDGRFGPQTLLLERPATRPGTYAFGDVDRDGDTDLAQLAGRMAGLYEHARAEGRWLGFRPFPELPHVEGVRGRAQWLDLNGDGRADIVVAKGDRLAWFPSNGEGFDAPVEVLLPQSTMPAPAEDPALEVFFADMNGDGLVDVVRVGNGRVEYWPSHGNGRFGDSILLDDAPQFAPAGEFDAARVRLVDVDGSGSADIVYLGRGEARVWLNGSGNRLLAGPVLTGLPYLDAVSSVRVLDFLGDGRPCLVWSTPLPGRSALQYLPLMPAEHPRLLVAVDNSLGQETRYTYSTSAAHYLRNEALGRPWSTRLPHHVTVVDLREVYDRIGDTRGSRRYEYRDGIFDGRDGAFRGFGRVDTYDVDSVGDGPAFSPPSLVRTWYDHGAFAPAVPDGAYRDPDLALLPPHTLDPALASEEDIENALQAVMGREIRSESYSVDESGVPAAHPFVVVQTSHHVARRQPADGEAEVAVAVTSETMTAVYEQSGGDPRVTQHVLFETDDYELPMRDAEIAHARRAGRPRDDPAQDQTSVIVHEHRFLNIDTRTRFELGIPIESRDLELAGLAGAGVRITRETLRAANLAAAPVRTWQRAHYWNDARDAALAHGQAGAITLIHHEESACFSDAFLQAALLANAPDAQRLTALGYVQHDGLWWQPAETHTFAPPQQFCVRTALEAVSGAPTTFAYDAYALEIVEQIDAAGNRWTATIDYNLVAPSGITDPNGTVREVRYDALGVIVATTIRGSVGAEAWGFDAMNAIVARTPQALGDLLADPRHYLQGAATYLHYDLDAWQRDRTPPVVASLLAEDLRHDGAGGGNANGPIGGAVTYLDGFGRELQKKVLVEPGPAIQRDANGIVIVDGGGRPVLAPTAERWQVSGHVVHDRKQQAGRRYQPYFSPSVAYESDVVLREFGITTVTQYDAVGRAVSYLFPNGTFATTTYRAWNVEKADANDTVDGSAYRAARIGRPPDDPERQALTHAERHVGTTTFSYLDPRGREVATRAQGGATANDRTTSTTLDHDGLPLRTIDPRGIAAFTWTRDMAGRVIHERSVDAGDKWTLPDALDREIDVWTASGYAVRRTFDRLDRLLTIHVTGNNLDHRVEERVYGEGVAGAAANNLRGELATLRDGAGEITIDRYDPLGSMLSTTRRLRTNLDGEPHWGGPVALDGTAFTTTRTFDARSRVRTIVQPDGTSRTLTYSRAGMLARETVTTPGGALVDVAVSDATYGARNERTRLVLGNGVDVSYGYEEETQRLTSQVALRGAARLQDIALTFDPAGNLVRLADRAHEGANPLIPGVAVGARRDFEYDAHYRLTRATGRVHQALLRRDSIPAPGGPLKGTRHITLDNGAAIERYTRDYRYDRSGNLTRIRHLSDSSQWTTDLWVSNTSNRSLPALDTNDLPIADPEARFDAAGNVRELDHLRAIDWSWRGTLSRAVVIQRPGGTDDGEVYAYGADGLRVSKVATRVIANNEIEVTEKVYFGSCERKRIRIGGNLILERWTSEFIDPVTGGQIAFLHRWERDDLARETDAPNQPRLRYQLETHQGSSSLTLDEAGNLLTYEEYFPYGSTAFMAGDSAREIEMKEYRFTGRERDDATSLYAYGHRYYAPWIGRWISPDPAGPIDDLNLYQFVLGDPVGNVDFSGLQTEKIDWIGQVQKGATEAQAIEEFNRTQALDVGYFVTDLEPVDGGNWLVVGKDPIPEQVLEIARKTNDVDFAEFMTAITQMKIGSLENLEELAKEQQPPPEAGDGGEDAETTEAKEAKTEEGTEDGEDEVTIDVPEPENEGAGQEDLGGKGGGGEDENTAGAGGDQKELTPNDARAADEQANAANEGTKEGQDDVNRAGSRNGVDGGSTEGVPGGTSLAPPQNGTGRDTVDETGTVSGNGVENGGTSPPTGPAGEPRGNADRGGVNAAPPGDPAFNRAGHPQGTPEGRRLEGPPGGTKGGSTDPNMAGQSGGVAGGQPQPPEDALDVLTRWAGYANFEFGGGKPEGQRRGIPGGRGTLNLGWAGPVAYIGLTVLSWVGPGAIFKGAKLGFMGLKAGSALALATGRTAVRSAVTKGEQLAFRFAQRFAGGANTVAADAAIKAAENAGRQILYHYTTDKGLVAILKSNKLFASFGAKNARYGPGVYLTDIAPSRIIPGTIRGGANPVWPQMTLGQLARLFFARPFTAKVKSYVAVDVTGLGAKEVAQNNWLISRLTDLDITGRIITYGRTLP